VTYFPRSSPFLRLIPPRICGSHKFTQPWVRRGSRYFVSILRLLICTTLSAPSVSCATPTTGAEIVPIPTSAIASQLAQKNEDHPDHTHITQRLKRLLSCSEYSKVKFSPILKMGAPRIRTQEQGIRCAAEVARFNEILCAFVTALLPPATPANHT
jgi:hypothetical protein